MVINQKNDHKKNIRILTYNIHKGVNFLTRSLTIEKIKKSIQKIDADVVLLQEVGANHRNDRDWWENHFEYLADEVWSHYAYGKNAIYGHGNHGNAILSKYPIEEWENINISTNSFEKRGLLIGKIKLGLGSIVIGNTHLNLLNASRVVQIKKIISVMRPLLGHNPVILGGDFNDWGSTSVLPICDELGFSEVFEELHGSYAQSFPSFFPILKLDRIYCRGFKPVRAEVLRGSPWQSLSDHVPLWAELEILL